MRVNRSHELYREAEKYIPGGVNSPVRAFRAVNLDPLFIAKGEGCRIYDVDGNEYIDHVCSWGPLILGHAHPQVVAALRAAVGKGSSYGACTELEVEMAKFITAAVPSIEKVRMTSSGTEAAMSAIRLARAYTGREKMVKFEGGYHGHGDSFLVKAGSGVATLGLPDSRGVTKGSAKDSITLPYNNLEAVGKFIKDQAEEIACVIVEPIAGNMGVIPPQEGFLEGLRRLTTEHRIILIFDEVISGFRVDFGGAQALYSVYPDLTCLGKIIGGGLPVGALGGKREIMDLLAPQGDVYQAGTLSGNPIAMTAGLTTLKILSDKRIYDDLQRKSAKLEQGIRKNVEDLGMKVCFNRVGSMFSLFFTNDKVFDYQIAKGSDTDKYALYFRRMLEQGIYLPPSQFESSFLSTAHEEADLDKTIEASFWALKAVKEKYGA